MLNLDHQCPSSVRRDESSTDISAHVRKEAQLRHQFEQERAARLQLTEQFAAEQDAIKSKTKQVLDLMKQKIASVEKDLSLVVADNATLNKNHTISIDLLRKHYSNLVFWSGELQRVSNAEELASILSLHPLRLLFQHSDVAEVEVSNGAEVVDLIVGEMDAILRVMENVNGVIDCAQLPFVAVVAAVDKVVPSGSGATNNGPATPVRKPLQEIDSNLSIETNENNTLKGDVQPMTPRRGAVAPLTPRATGRPPPRRLSRSSSGTPFPIYEEVSSAAQGASAAESEDQSLQSARMVELEAQLDTSEQTVAQLRVENVTLTAALATETAHAAELRQSIQKLENKVVKLKSGLEKSRSETVAAREALQRERDEQFTLQLRHTSEKEALAARMTEALQQQQAELDSLREIVARPNAAVLALEAQLVRAEEEGSQLRRQVAERDASTKALQAQLEQLQRGKRESLAVMEASHALEIDDATRQVTALQQRLVEVSAEAVEYKGTAQVLQSRVDLLKMRLAETERSCAEHSTSLETAQRDVQGLRSAEAKLQARVTELEQSLSSHQTASEEERAQILASLLASEQEVGRLTSQLTAERDRGAQLAASLADMEALVQQSETARADLNGRVAAADIEKAALQAEVQRLRDEIGDLQAKLSAAEVCHAEERARLAEELSAAMGAGEELSTKMLLRSAQEAALTAQLRTCEQTLSSLREDIAQRTTEHVQLVAEIAAVKISQAEAKSRIATLTAERDELEEDVSRLRAAADERLTEHQETVATLHTELEQTRALLVAEKKARDTQAAELEAALMISRTQLEELINKTTTERLAWQEALESTHVASANQLAELQAELQTARDDSTASKERLATLEEELRQAVQGAESERHELQAQLEFWSEKWVECDRALKESCAETNSALEELAAAREVLSQLRYEQDQALMVAADQESRLVGVVCMLASIQEELTATHTEKESLLQAHTAEIVGVMQRVREQTCLLEEQDCFLWDLEKLVAYQDQSHRKATGSQHTQIEAQQAKIEELSAVSAQHLQRLQLSEALSEVLTKQLQHTKESLENENVRAAMLQSAVETTNDRIVDLETQLDVARAEAVRTAAELTEQLAACETARAEVLSLTQQLDAARFDTVNGQEEARRREAALEDSMRELQAQLCDATAATERLALELEGSITARGMLTEEAAVLQARLSSALMDAATDKQEAVVALQLARAEAETLKLRIVDMAAEVESLRVSLQSVAAERDDLRATLAKRVTELDVLHADLSALREANAASETQTVTLAQDLSAAGEQLQKMEAELSHVSVERKALAQQLAHAERNLVAVRMEMDARVLAATEKIEALECSLRSALSDRDAVAQQVAVAQEQLAELAAGYSAALADKDSALTSAAEQLRSLEKEQEHAAVREEAIRKQLVDAHDHLREVEASFALSRSDMDAARSAFERKLQEAVSARDSLSQQLTAADNRLVDVDAVLAAIRTESESALAATMHKINTLQESLSDTLSARDALNAQLLGTQAQLAAVESSYKASLSAMEKDLAAAVDRSIELETALSACVAERNVLSQDLAEAQDRRVATATESESTLLEVTAKLAAVTEQAAELEGELTQAASARDLLLLQLEQAQESLEAVKAVHAADQSAMEAHYAAALSEKENTILTHMESIASLRAGLEESTVRCDTLTEELGLTRQEVAAKAAAQAVLEDKLAGLSAALDEERRQAAGAASSTQCELQALRAELAGAEQRGQSMEVSIAELSDQLVGARAEAERLQKALTATVGHVQRLEGELRVECDAAAGTARRLIEKESEAAELSALVQKLSKEKAVQAAVISSLRERMAVDEQNTAALTERLATQEATVADLQAQLAAQLAASEDLQRSLNVVSTRLETVEAESARLGEVEAALTDERTQLQERTARLLTDLSAGAERVHVLECELETLSDARAQDQVLHLTELKDKDFAISRLQEDLKASELDHAATIRELQASLAALTAARESDSVTYIAELDRRDAEIARLEQALRQYRSTVAELEHALRGEAELKEQREQECTELKREVAGHLATMSSLETQLKECQERHGVELQELQGELQRVDGELAAAQTEIEGVSSALQDRELQLQSEVAAQQQLREEHSKALGDLAHERDLLQSKLLTMKTEYDTACADLFQRSADLDSIRAELTQGRVAFEAATAVWAEREDTLTEEVHQLQALLEERRDEVASLRSEVADEQAHAATLTTTVKELTTAVSAAEDTAATSAEEVARLGAFLAETNEQLQDAAARCRAVEEELSQRTVLTASLQEELQRLAALAEQESARADNVEAELVRLTSEVQSERATSAQLLAENHALLAQITQLSDNLAAESAATERIAEECQDLRSSLSAVQDAHRESAADVARLTQRLEESALHATELITKISGQHEELSSAVALADERAAKVTALSVKYEQVSEQASQAEEKVVALTANCEQLRIDLSTKEEQCTALCAQVESYTIRVTELSDTLSAESAGRNHLQEECTELRSTLAASEIAHRECVAEVTRLTHSLEEAAQLAADASTSNADLQNQLSAAVSLAEARLAESSALAAQLAQVSLQAREAEEKIASLIFTCDELRVAMAAKEEECALLQSHVDVSTARVTELVERLHSLHNEQEAAAREHADAVAAAEQASRELHSEVAGLQSELDTSTARCRDLESQVTASNAAAETRCAEVAALTEQVREVHAQLLQMTAMHNDLAMAMTEERAKMEQARQAAEEQVASLESSLRAMTQEEEQLVASHAALALSLEEAETTRTAAETELTTVQTALATATEQLEAAGLLRCELKARLQASSEQAQRQETASATISAQLGLTRFERDTAQAELARLKESTQGAITEWSQRVAGLDADKAALSAALAEAKLSHAEADNAHAEAVTALRAELAAVREAETRVTERVVTHELTIAELASELTDNQLLQARLRQELAAASSEVEHFAAKVQALEEEIVKRSERVTSLTAELDSATQSLTATKQAYEQETQALTTKLALCEEDIAQLQTVKTAHLEELSTLRAELTEQSAMVEQLTTDLTALQTKHDDVCVVAYQHHQAADAVAAQLERMKSEHAEAVTALEAQLSTQGTAAEALSTELVALRAEHVKSQEAHATHIKLLSDENSALSVLVTELEVQSQELTSQRASLETVLEERNKALAMKVAELVAAQMALQQSRAAMETLCADLQEKTALVEVLDKTRQALMKDIQDLNAQNNELIQETRDCADRLRAVECELTEALSRAEHSEQSLASLREVSETQATHYSAEREAHLREVFHLREAVRERERVAQELNVRLLSVIEGSDDNRRKAQEAEAAHDRVLALKEQAVAELEKLQEEHAVVVAQEHLRSKEAADLRERLRQSEAVAAEVRQQLVARSAWSTELSSHVQQSQEAVMRLSQELAAKESQLHRANASLVALTSELRAHEEVNLKLDIQAQGLGKALQELRGRLAEQEQAHIEACKTMEEERGKLLEKIQESEFVILELNSTLEQECSAVVELEAKLEENKKNLSMQDVSGDEASDVLLARIQILDDNITDLERQLGQRTAELQQVQADLKDREETLSSLQHQLEQFHQCKTPEATRTEYARREQELREALTHHYELQVKSLSEKLSTTEQLLATTQHELQQLHDSHGDSTMHAAEDQSHCQEAPAASLSSEEVRALQKSLFRMKTKVASKSKQILLLNQQMLRDRQHFQKLKKSLVKLDGLKSLMFANNANPVVAPPLPVHQVTELYHLGMEEAEKRLSTQHDAEVATQRAEMIAIQNQLRSTLEAIHSTQTARQNVSAGEPQAMQLNKRVLQLQAELRAKEEAHYGLIRRIEQHRQQRSEAEAKHYLALSKYKMECAALRKTIESLQQRRSAGKDTVDSAENSNLAAQLEQAKTQLEVQRRIQAEQENKFARAVRTLKAMEARGQALGEQCAAAHTEVAALQAQLKQQEQQAVEARGEN